MDARCTQAKSDDARGHRRYSRLVPTLEETSLTPTERRTLERFVKLLERELGDDVLGVWLYGSRARGEPPADESDIDLIVITPRGWDDLSRVMKLMDQAAEAEGAKAAFFSVHVYDPAHIARRREIRSFFIQEVDRDKIVLAGEP
jgi:predicted nucleotidyltransferase